MFIASSVPSQHKQCFDFLPPKKKLFIFAHEELKPKGRKKQSTLLKFYAPMTLSASYILTFYYIKKIIYKQQTIFALFLFLYYFSFSIATTVVNYQLSC